MPKVAFVCVGNAGRSQMATAYAEVEVERRGLEEELEIITGGTDPHDEVHEEVVEVLEEEDIDIRDRTPRQITADELDDVDYIVTMGCDAAEFTPEDWDGTAEQWEIDHPGGDDLDSVRDQRDRIKQRVGQYVDLLQA